MRSPKPCFHPPVIGTERRLSCGRVRVACCDSTCDCVSSRGLSVRFDLCPCHLRLVYGPSAVGPRARRSPVAVRCAAMFSVCTRHGPHRRGRSRAEGIVVAHAAACGCAGEKTLNCSSWGATNRTNEIRKARRGTARVSRFTFLFGVRDVPRSIYLHDIDVRPGPHTYQRHLVMTHYESRA